MTTQSESRHIPRVDGQRRHPFLQALHTAHLLCDGAMGTQLYARGVALDACFDALNLREPRVVESVHRDYILAGAQVVETNTFGANAIQLAGHGLASQVAEINWRGARLAISARESAGEPIYVAGAVGPLGAALAPFGQISQAEAVAHYAEQIEALAGAGVDLLVLETFGDLEELIAAITAARAVCDLPVVAQVTFTVDDLTPLGAAPEEAVTRLVGAGADVIGTNCSVGPQHMLAVIQRMAAAAPEALLSAQPNAGWPSQVGGRIVYLSSPDYMAAMGLRLIEAGARLVGGCCGTTPEHTRALKRALAAPAPVPSGPRGVAVSHQPPASLRAELADTRPAPLDGGAAGLTAKIGRLFVISAELRPPRGANPRKMLQGATLLRDAGVDAVNVLDGARAKVFMNTLVAGFLIARDAGVETILHMTTRDRNLRGLQSDLIGAHALGARAVLALTGDPPAMGAYGGAKGVYEVDSVGLIRVIGRLNEGVDVAGASIGKPTEFLVGCAFDPGAPDLDLQVERLHQKLEAGARFVMTQPVYSPELFQRALQRAGPIRVPILMGLLPPVNLRNAEFLHHEMPGITLSDEALERMRRVGPDGGAEEGMAIVYEVLRACRGLVAGAYIMPQFDRYDMAAQLVREIRRGESQEQPSSEHAHLAYEIEERP